MQTRVIVGLQGSEQRLRTHVCLSGEAKNTRDSGKRRRKVLNTICQVFKDRLNAGTRNSC